MGKLNITFEKEYNDIRNIRKNENLLDKNEIFKTNNIFSAKIFKKDDKFTTLITEFDRKFNVKSEDIKDDSQEKLYFQVIQNNNDGKFLKQIFLKPYEDIFSKNKIKKIQSAKILSIQDNFIDEIKKNNEKEQAKKIQAIMQIKRKQLYGLNNNSTTFVKELIENGINIENMDFSLVSKIMFEINSAKTEKISLKDINQTIHNYFKNKSHLSLEQKTMKKLVQKLVQNDIPINDNNVKIMVNFINKLQGSMDLNQNGIIVLLNNQDEISLENICFAKHIQNLNPNYKNPSDNSFLGFDKELFKHFKREDIEYSNENKNISKFLMENYLPITKENVEKTRFLVNISKEIDMNKLLDDVAKGIKSDKNIDKIILFQNNGTMNAEKDRLLKVYDEIVESLPKINLDRVQLLLKSKIPLTLSNLRNENYENSADNFVNQKDFSPQIIEARRQILEIQLKLTKEAASRLSHLEINIDTIPLERALNNIKSMENIKYAKNLKLMGERSDIENLNMIGSLYENLDIITPLPTHLFKEIILHKSDFNINSMSKLVNNERLIHEFEIFSTLPNQKYGDSFSEIRKQISPFLKEIRIPSTAMNISAFEILSKNKLDITAENIKRIKMISNKIEYVVNRLHPNIAASMIYEGINPLDIHIDEIISYIDEFNGVFGESLRDKIGKYIMQIDDSKTLNDETRAAMLAVYRTLYQIQKDNGVGFGIALKKDLTQNLGQLFEASKYFQKTKGDKSLIDYHIDENFGGLKDLKDSGKTIRNIIDEGVLAARNKIFKYFENQEYRNIFDDLYMAETHSNLNNLLTLSETENKISHLNILNISNNKFLLNNISEKINPQILEKLIEETPGYLDMPLEDLHLKINSQNNNLQKDFEISEISEKLRQIFITSPKVIQWMESSKIPTNPANITLINQFLKDQFYLCKEINRVNDEYNLNLKDNIQNENLSELLNGKPPKEILKDIYMKLENYKNTVDKPDAFKDFSIIQNGIKLQNMLQHRKSASEYRLPLKINDKIKNLNLHIFDNKILGNKKEKISFALNTDNIGDIQIDLNINDDSVKLDINCNIPENLNYIKNQSLKLVNYINNAGFIVDQIYFNLRNPRNILAEDIYGVGKQ